MPIPKFYEFFRPVLALAEQGPVQVRNLLEPMAQKFDLSEEDRAELTRNKRKTRIYDRTSWAMKYLWQAGLVERVSRGTYEITERGKSVLASDDTIDKNYLRQFPEFRKYADGDANNEDATENAESEKNIVEDRTPNEELRRAYKTINADLASDLLERVRSKGDKFLEYLAVELLQKIYGNSGKVLGGSGDGGVDGVIDQDALGLEKIYIQTKCNHAGNTIGPGTIQAFAGALDQKKATKGVFITTSAFTQGARDAVRVLSAQIVLIDGEKLAELMTHYNVGCREMDTLSIKKIDEDFFEDAE